MIFELFIHLSLKLMVVYGSCFRKLSFRIVFENTKNIVFIYENRYCFLNSVFSIFLIV